jgi:DNA invertase Pin-like site-specific DNA recombinase
MLIGYMRVSKSDGSQVLNSQQNALLAAGVLPEQIYQDFSSGKNDNRQGLIACLKAVRKGDTLIVWKLDRLGRNLKHLVDTLHDLSSKGVDFKVLSGQGAQIDTSTPQGLWCLGYLLH